LQEKYGDETSGPMHSSDHLAATWQQ